MRRRRVFFFSLHQSPSKRPLEAQIHLTRDSGAFMYLLQVLADRWEFGETLLNIPAGVFDGDPPLSADFEFEDGIYCIVDCAEDPEFKQHVIEIRADDVLCVTTRPPLDDPEDARRSILLSGSPLENDVLGVLRMFFDHCSRDIIVLSDAVRRGESVSGGADWSFRAVKYRVNAPGREPEHHAAIVSHGDFADYMKLRPANTMDGSTLGYITWTPHMQIDGSDGPGLLSCFSMDGTSTLLWAQLCRKELAPKIHEIMESPVPRLFVGRFVPAFRSGVRPVSVSLRERTDDVPRVMPVIDVAF